MSAENEFNEDMELSYILNELGEERSEYFNSIAPPIIQTSNFAVRKVEELRKLFVDEYSGYLYSRGLNPTLDILRKKLAALDGAEDCLVFNSGASAILCSVMANVKSGDHIVSVDKPYTWARNLFDKILPRFGVTTTYVDGRQIENFERAVLPHTSVIYLETPNSWNYALQDLAAVSSLAKAEDIITICDNSYCSPIYQKPLDFGIDMTLQSASKYIGGHSDVVAGVLTGSRKHMKKIFDSEYLNTGAGATPFHAWLMLRGLRTLPLRLEKISQNTLIMVDWLKNHPKIENVLYPMDPSFPQYELARKQMKGGCGLVSFSVRADTMQDIETFCESLKHIMMAVSWGGYESLSIPSCASIKPSRFDAHNTEHRMIRFYIGLEDPTYLIADLEQALAKMKP